MSDAPRRITGHPATASTAPTAYVHPEEVALSMSSPASPAPQKSTARRAGPQAEGPDHSRRLDAARLKTVGRAYLVGIGGVGMSGAARILEARGVDVRGSDRHPPAGADPDNTPLPAALDLLVYSAAVPRGHAQRLEAERRGIHTCRYADLLGALMEDRFGICVAGSHGKTTTSSMLASALLFAERDPSFVIGGRLVGYGGGARSGAGREFLAESCEFDRSFHAHRPRVGIITNVDEDHLDYYADLAEIQESFRVFASLLPDDGALIVNDAYVRLFRTDKRIRATIQSYGFGEDAWWHVGEPRLIDGGPETAFSLSERGRSFGEIRIPLAGRHNVLNAAAAAAALFACGLAEAQIPAALEAFRGVARRQELIAERGGITLLDDYGHHPTEIRAVIRSLRHCYEGRRLVIIFQPHQASRTRCLMKDFAAALAEADEVWLPPIFFARDSEEERRMVTSEDLAARVRNEGGQALTLPDLAAAVRHGAAQLRAGDVAVTMGAGNVDEVARGLADCL